MIYHVDGLQSFTSISRSLPHDPAAIWAHLRPVLCDLKANHPEITDIRFFSDGPTTQYTVCLKKKTSPTFLAVTRESIVGFS